MFSAALLAACYGLAPVSAVAAPKPATSAYGQVGRCGPAPAEAKSAKGACFKRLGAPWGPNPMDGNKCQFWSSDPSITRVCNK